MKKGGEELIAGVCALAVFAALFFGVPWLARAFLAYVTWVFK